MYLKSNLQFKRKYIVEVFEILISFFCGKIDFYFFFPFSILLIAMFEKITYRWNLKNSGCGNFWKWKRFFIFEICSLSIFIWRLKLGTFHKLKCFNQRKSSHLMPHEFTLIFLIFSYHRHFKLKATKFLFSNDTKNFIFLFSSPPFFNWDFPLPFCNFSWYESFVLLLSLCMLCVWCSYFLKHTRLASSK